jgi:hypothetical protein
MENELSPAVAVLQRKLEEQLKGVGETKKLINMLLKSMGQPALYEETSESSGIIRADQFYGKPLATAAQEYLEMRKQACQPDEILRGLSAGGFDFDVAGWKEDDRLRSLAISLAKNVVKFHRLKNGSFGLKSWYDAEFLKKAAARKASAADASDEEQNSAVTEYVPKIGDQVQWEVNGTLKLPEARKIVSFSDDAAYAFLEGSNGTGVPIGELIKDEPIAAKPSAKSKSRPAADRTA